VDISDPENPVIAGAVDTRGGANGVAVSGDYAYVANSTSWLQVVDISDPANPVIAGAVVTPGSTKGVTVSGDYVYVASNRSGLVIFRAIPDAP
jgi:hypothetical protein